MNKYKAIHELEFDLLQCKYVYYNAPDLHGVSDSTYDDMEQEYLDLCDECKINPWVYYMVGYDSNNTLHELIEKSVKEYGGVNAEI